MSAVAERPIRVAVVDDQELFARGIGMLIESQADLELVATAGDGTEALELVEFLRPDVVLMDIRMPVMSGIEATLRITGAEGAGSRVIVLTTFQQEEAVYLSMKHGASAFVTKDVTPDVLLETIRAVHGGDAPPAPITSPGSLTALVRRHRATAANGETAGDPADGPVGDGARSGDTPPALAALSPREREIYLLAATGLRNAGIAAAAFVSEATVKSHIRRILAKLGLTSRAQIVVHAYENRLLP